MRINKGASITQYAIILACLVLVTIPVFFGFGQTIVGSFTHFYNVLSNSNTQANNNNQNSNPSPNNNPGTGQNTDPGTDPGTTPGTDPGADPGTNPGNPSIISTIDVDGTEVSIHNDGSASFEILGNPISLGADEISNINEVMETSGATGMNSSLMLAFNKLIEMNGGTVNPGEIEMVFGSSSRTCVNKEYLGSASANSIRLSLGDNLVIVDKPHQLLNSGGDIEDIAPNTDVMVLAGNKSGGTYSADVFCQPGDTNQYCGGNLDFDVSGNVFDKPTPNHLWNIDFSNGTPTNI